MERGMGMNETRNKSCSGQKLAEHWQSYDLRGTFCLLTMANLLALRDGVLLVYYKLHTFYG